MQPSAHNGLKRSWFDFSEAFGFNSRRLAPRVAVKQGHGVLDFGACTNMEPDGSMHSRMP